MKIQFIASLLFAVALIACNNKPKPRPDADSSSPETSPSPSAESKTNVPCVSPCTYVAYDRKEPPLNLPGENGKQGLPLLTVEHDALTKAIETVPADQPDPHVHADEDKGKLVFRVDPPGQNDTPGTAEPARVQIAAQGVPAKTVRMVVSPAAARILRERTAPGQ